MQVQNYGRLIRQARDAQKAFQQAAANARIIGDRPSAGYMDRQAAFEGWRAEQYELMRKGLWERPPTRGEWEATAAHEINGQARFTFA